MGSRLFLTLRTNIVRYVDVLISAAFRHFYASLIVPSVRSLKMILYERTFDPNKDTKIVLLEDWKIYFKSKKSIGFPPKKQRFGPRQVFNGFGRNSVNWVE